MSLTEKQGKLLVDLLFQSYDENHNGHLEKKECLQLFKDISIANKDEHMKINSIKYIKYLDKDRDGTISKQELLDLLLDRVE